MPTYLRLAGLKLGYLLNFGEALMRDGITRIIHGNLDPDPPCLRASLREKFRDRRPPQNTEHTGLSRPPLPALVVAARQPPPFSPFSPSNMQSPD
ncbi:MAG: GxxExxY protein [Verrucomicrobia bacterium]|nr:GxxExxY protein [Verrucomicrobiota bacterium]